MTNQPMPAPVAEVFARFPEPIRARLLQIREMIFTVADETGGVGPLTETLKWGEPAYLTEKSGSGTTIRLGISKAAPEDCAVFVNCKTNLIETFRAHFADNFAFEGQRALIIPANDTLRREPLALCLQAALTYHRQKTAEKIRPS